MSTLPASYPRRLVALSLRLGNSGFAPFAALVLAGLLWGTSDVAGKVALATLPPATLAALRFGVALAILWPLARRYGGTRVPARVAAPLGLLGVALAFLLQNLGLERTSASNASLLQGAAPVLTLLLAAVVLGEPLGRRRVVAVGVVMGGVVIVTLPGDGGLQAPGIGDALVLASTACFATFVVLGRRAFPVYGTFPVLAGMAAWGTAALAPLAAFELNRSPTVSLAPGNVALVVYLGVGCSALTYGLWGYALRHLDAGRAAMFDALIPVVGVSTAVLVLREPGQLTHLLGGAFVVAGVWMASHESLVTASPSTDVAPPRTSRDGWWVKRPGREGERARAADIIEGSALDAVLPRRRKTAHAQG